MTGRPAELAGPAGPPRAASPARGRRRPGRITFWLVLGLAAFLGIGGTAGGIISMFAGVRQYQMTSAAMEPTIRPGQRVLVAVGAVVRRGDVIVFRRAGESPPYIERLIGLPGDHVACCDARGRVTVNGWALSESYVYRRDRPSAVSFSVTLGRGQIWVLGDHRSLADDSRFQGSARLSKVIGRAFGVGTALSFTPLGTPQAFVADRLAPPDHRGEPGSPALLAVGAAGLAAVGIMTILGTVRFAQRRRRSRAARPGQLAG